LEGKRIGFGSYGSGSSAMVFSGVVQPRYKEIVKDMNLEAEIGDRRRLTWDEYEELHENKVSPEKSMVHSKKEFVLVHVNTEKESRGERRYVYNE
jgi:hydroxymethylglutaryl-CoA synthase